MKRIDLLELMSAADTKYVDEAIAWQKRRKVKRALILSASVAVYALFCFGVVRFAAGNFGFLPGHSGTDTQHEQTETEDSRDTDTDVSPEVSKYTLNPDFLSDYGKTYGELKEKYGEQTTEGLLEIFPIADPAVVEGYRCYQFINGQGLYWFGQVPRFYSGRVTDEENFNYRSLSDEDICRGIFDIPMTDFILEPFNRMTLEELSMIDGIEIIEEEAVRKDPSSPHQGEYVTVIRYNGWGPFEREHINIEIYHRKRYVIDSYSSVGFRLPIEYLKKDSSEIQMPYSLNTDLFSDYGKTFGELKARRGELSGFIYFEALSHYQFENGYGNYWFGQGVGSLEEYVTDEKGGFTYRPIPDEAICRGIEYVDMSHFVAEPFEGMTLDELSEIGGIEIIQNEFSPPNGKYLTMIRYNGWEQFERERITIFIIHEDENVIEPSDKLRFHLPPSYLKSENWEIQTDYVLNSHLMEYGRPYGMLKAEYGDVVETVSTSYGIQYKLENGYGNYWFGQSAEGADDGIGDDSVCRGVFGISMADLISPSFESMTIDELLTIKGIDVIETHYSETENGYITTIKYGWADPNRIAMQHWIFHEKENIIDSSSTFSFYLPIQES